MTTKISASLSFFVSAGKASPEYWISIVKEIIDNLNNEFLRDANIVSVENTAEDHKYTDYFGIEIAMRILRVNPLAKIILYGFSTLDMIREKNSEVDVVLKHANAFWVRAPFTQNELTEALNNKQALVSDSAVSKEVQKYLGSIFHALNYVKDWQYPVDNNERSAVERGLKQTREYFPAMSSASDEEVFDFLRSVAYSRTELMKGEEISGVYCDVEGTIVVDDKVNEKVMAKLHEYEAKGMTITLWTDGTVALIGNKLKRLGISYPLKSKYDFAGATAEVVIDDNDEFSFTALTKINAKSFIKVSTL